MSNRGIRYCNIVFYDDEIKTFNIEGPVTNFDDIYYTKKTSQLQKQGRKVRISYTKLEKKKEDVCPIEPLIKEGITNFKYDPNLKW